MLTTFLYRLAETLADATDGWKRRLEERLFRGGERVRFEAGQADSGIMVEGLLQGIGAAGELLIKPEGELSVRAFVSGELKVYD